MTSFVKITGFLGLVTFSLLVFTVLDGCAPKVLDTQQRLETAFRPSCGKAPAWARTGVFYEIFVRSFQDSDNDGIGDFDGLIRRLGYLNDGNPETVTDLGVTAIWLMPVFPTKTYHGYDVVDYRHINSEYGGDAAFERFLTEAHNRGIKVILDLMLNHTSWENPWFARAQKDLAGPGGSWYLWEKVRPSGWGWPWGGGQSENVWHKASKLDAYYYGAFDHQMPDLNWRNPEVKMEMFEIAREWLRKGVDGFRLDAVRYLVENGPTDAADTRETHRILQEFSTVCRAEKPDCYLVGEAWTVLPIMKQYYGDGCELHSCFDFDRAQSILHTVLSGNAEELEDLLDNQEVTNIPWEFFAQFLSNHDQTRSAEMLQEHQGRMKAAASLLLTLPGIPFMYYGEEIGTVGNKPDPNLRRPMSWDDSPAAGFSSGKLWHELADNYEDENVASQAADPDSLLNHYKKLIRLRTATAALTSGDYLVLDGQSRCCCFARTTQEEVIIVIINLSPMAITQPKIDLRALDLVTGEPRNFVATDLITAREIPLTTTQSKVPWLVETELQGYGTLVLKLTL